MRYFTVTLPIAGHAYVSVEAEDETAAIQKALEVVKTDDIGDWEAFETFSEGNVLYCPRPWDAEATDEGPVE